MKIAILQFPGTNCDYDVAHVLSRMLKVPTRNVWHHTFKERDFSAAILPGGFSFGDYLRAGAIASHSPAMDEIRKMSKRGKPILGICNGFQVLTEAGILPGALLPNGRLNFVCKWTRLVCRSRNTPFTTRLQLNDYLHMPIAHQEGRFFTDHDGLRTLESNHQIVFQYVDDKGNTEPTANPNGSLANIAGLCNEERNVVGLMPHPERASEAVLSPFGDNDGLLLFQSLVDSVGGC